MHIVPWHGVSDGVEGSLIGGHKYRMTGFATTTGTCKELTPNDGDAKIRLFTHYLGNDVTDIPFSAEFTMREGYSGKGIPLYWQIHVSGPNNTLGLKNLRLDEIIDIPIGVNLVNASECTLGYQMTETGELKADRFSYATGYIRIVDSQTYNIVTGINYPTCWVCWYDIKKNLISSVNYGEHWGTSGGNYTPPAGACYVRFTGYSELETERWGSIKRIE